MINIFNLFLTLFFLCLLFACSNGNITPHHFSWLFVLIAFFSSIIASLVAYKLKIFNKDSHFSFLHFGFYRHFIKLFFSAFLQSILVVFRIAISSRKIEPKIYSLPIEELEIHTLNLLIFTINMTPGLLFIDLIDDKIVILGLNKSYIEKLDLKQIIRQIDRVDDNKLV